MGSTEGQKTLAVSCYQNRGRGIIAVPVGVFKVLWQALKEFAYHQTFGCHNFVVVPHCNEVGGPRQAEKQPLGLQTSVSQRCNLSQVK